MVEITNLARQKADKDFLKKVAQKTLEFLGKKKFDEISLVLVDERKIKEINKKYRGKNQLTDVLSFEGLDEIFICPQAIKKQAQRLKIPYRSELTRIFVHGILHLSGYEHKNKKSAKRMWTTEEKVLKRIISEK